MGQSKEGAQVAMKHTISDLWKAVAAQDAMPALSPVVPTVTIKMVDHDAATLQSLERCLSGVAKKSLLA